MTALTVSCSRCDKEVTGRVHYDYDDIHWCSLCYYDVFLPWAKKEHKERKEKMDEENLKLQQLKNQIDSANVIHTAAKKGDLGKKGDVCPGYGEI